MGGGGGGVVGVDFSVDSVIGVVVGRDVIFCVVRRVVDDVFRAEALFIVGVDIGCGE